MSEETLQKARKELNEIPGEKEDKVKSLREKIAALQEQGKLPKNCRMDDKMLVRFLRANKYDLDKSLNQYNNYQQFRYSIQCYLIRNRYQSEKIFLFMYMLCLDLRYQDYQWKN